MGSTWATLGPGSVGIPVAVGLVAWTLGVSGTMVTTAVVAGSTVFLLVVVVGTNAIKALQQCHDIGSGQGSLSGSLMQVSGSKVVVGS